MGKPEREYVPVWIAEFEDGEDVCFNVRLPDGVIRTVSVTDLDTDLNDLCRRIANHEFGVTREPKGILMVNGNSRRVCIGRWFTFWTRSRSRGVISFSFDHEDGRPSNWYRAAEMDKVNLEITR